MDLNDEVKGLLLKVARQSIEAIYSGSEIPDPDYEKHPILTSPSGAFVTLTIHKRLRGCIGYIESDKPLFETVKDAAVQAAQYDPRFAPLRFEELDKVHLEISVLSEPFPLNNYEEIVVGRHGLILEEEGRRGLLLPQVPIEHGMNREEFLDAICSKAGFNPGLWREKQLNIYLFTATVFSEE